MRIGLFTDTYLPDINGVVSSVYTLQCELEKHGHDVFVVTNHANMIQTEYSDNIIRLPGIELKQLYGYVLTSPIHFKAMEKIEQLNLDLIHVHTEFGVGILGRIISKRLKLPLVSTYHTTYEDYTHYVNIFNLDSLDRIAKKTVASFSKLYGDTSTVLISPSVKTKDMLLRYGVKTKIFVIPTGLNLKKFNAEMANIDQLSAIKEQHGISKSDFLVTFVGRIAAEKSIDILIDAFTYLKEYPKFKLMIVGGGPDLELLKEKAENLGIMDNVIFTDKVNSSIVQQYYFMSNVFSSASLTETQGMTYIEALASGLPVFARPDDVLNDIVIEGKTGFYFEDAKQLSEKIIAYEALSNNAKEKIKEDAVKMASNFDSEIFYESIMLAYQGAFDLYKDLYKLVKIRYKNDAIELTLEKPNDNVNLLISVDTFVKFGLRKDCLLTKEDLTALTEEQNYAKAYRACIRRLTFKDRTLKEMYDWLTQNTELSIEKINQIIERLEEKGYINDVKYVQSSIMNFKSLLQGKNKIIKNLVKKGIPKELIDEAFMNEDSSEEINLCIKYAEKIQGSITGHSVKYKKNLLKQKLYHQGFSFDVIDDVMRKLSFVEDERNEIETLKVDAEKAMKRYRNKYTGSKLRNMVYRYLTSKGYQYDDVYFVLNETEWNND